jgi:hypothetical protein
MTVRALYCQDDTCAVRLAHLNSARLAIFYWFVSHLNLQAHHDRPQPARRLWRCLMLVLVTRTQVYLYKAHSQRQSAKLKII